MYNFRTVNAYIAQCRWRRKIPTLHGLEAFTTPLKLSHRIIQPEPIIQERRNVGEGYCSSKALH